MVISGLGITTSGSRIRINSVLGQRGGRVQGLVLRAQASGFKVEGGGLVG